MIQITSTIGVGNTALGAFEMSRKDILTNRHLEKGF